MGRAHEVRAAAMAKTAAMKSKMNAKYGRLIYIAAKAGLPDPDVNQSLKKEIERAKKAQISADVIKRAIDKAKGSLADAYIQVRYEGFGPNNSMFIIECFTDNTNRTYTDIRTAVTRSGFKLGVDGSVIHMFDNLAVFSFEGMDDEKTLELLLEAGCDVTDITSEENLTTVYAPAIEYAKIRDTLEEAMPDVNFLEDQIAWVPKTYTALTDENDIKHFERLQGMLDELEEVQNLYHNIKFSE